MKTTVWLFVLFVMTCAATATYGQMNKGLNDDVKFGYFLENNLKKTRIPFELHANLILVYMQINEVDSLRFIIDTGVSSTIVTDPVALDTNRLNMIRKIKMSGIGEGNEIYGKVAIGNTIRIGKVRGNFQNVIVLQEDLLMLSEYIGVPVHGIIGFDILNHFVITIDFERKELIFMQHGEYKYKPSKGMSIPLEMINSKPYINSISLIENGIQRPVKVLLDTGAGHALLLTNNQNPPFKLPNKLLRAQLGWGLSGIINGNLGRINQVKLGRFELKDVVVSFPDSTAFASKLDSLTDRHGNMGCELLRRFKVTLNYKDQYMVLKPVKSKFREKFEHDMSGMDIKSDVKDHRFFRIAHVNKLSAADEAGLQQGDQLLFINHSPASELKASDVYKIFQSGDGRKIHLLVRRDSNIFFALLILRRMI